ncbi:MAG: sodium:calcium antiporter [Candidatus Binataceae bacterium]
MSIHIAILLISFAVILAGSEMFTNGVEWAGHHLSLSEAAVGSLLAAVGTALPETLIPAVALIMSHGVPGAHSEVGVGAIVGAPLMLSTIALFVMGVAALGFRRRRGRIALRVPRIDARRDLVFFLPVFIATVLLGMANLPAAARYALGAILLAVYASYAVVILKLRRSAETEVEHGLHLERVLGGNPFDPHGRSTVMQVLIGVVAILIGAYVFVDQIVFLSQHANLSPGVLSLILSPLATELPEKYNAVVWIRQSKDNLALANITGAMVFQSCIPVALGLVFTPWHLTSAELLGGAIAVFSAALLYVNLRDGELGTPTLILGGVAYAVFIAGLGWLGAL